MARIRINIIVTGKVQGVFYRQSALQEAQRLGLAGWIMNLPEGAVELEAEGESEPIADMVAWARVGPPAAQVETARVREMPPTGADRTFVVKR